MKFKRKIIGALSIIMTISLIGCSKPSKKPEEVNVSDKKYEQLLEEAKGTTVNFYGYGGNEVMNKWFDTYIIPQMKEKYDITLKRVGMNIDEILNNLQNSVQANEEKGNIDVIWINGENFYTAKENNLLFGPFTEKLPNFEKYVNGDADDTKLDFGYPTDGYEAPFGKAQVVMEYNSDKVKPIKNADELLEAAKANPGKFTYPALPDFTGSAFVRNIIYEKVGYDKLKDIDPTDEEAVREAIKPAMDYLKELKPYLWKKGETYPTDSTQQDNMFADGSLYFNVSYNPNHASSLISNGTYPESTKTCVFDKGTIGNTHFLAIAKNAPNKEGAMVVINEIEGFNSQLEKYKPEVWGDLPVIDNSKLSEKEKEEIDSVKLGSATLDQSELLEKRKPELPAAFVPVIEKIWTEEIPGK